MKPNNDPSKAGKLAGRPEFFGEFSRYKIAPVHTRFESVQWFVWDAESVDEITGKHVVIRQEDCRELALRGLSL